MTDTVRYAIGDLAELAGVSRRTVRYYVQEGLLPSPFGVGRGNHYGPEHLEQLARVKALQDAGRSLEEIKRALSGGSPPSFAVPGSDRAAEPSLQRSLWRRFTLAPGVELHVSGNVRLPSPGKLNDLAGWCRLHFHSSTINEDSDA